MASWGLDRLDSAAEVTKNHGVIHRLGAAGLCVAFQVAALWLPFVHVHPEDHETSHHRARAIHVHLSQHPLYPASKPGITIGDDGHDRAIFLQVFVAVAAVPFATSAVPLPVIDLVVPQEMLAHRSPDSVYGRAPPVSSFIASRAPPTFLS